MIHGTLCPGGPTEDEYKAIGEWRGVQVGRMRFVPPVVGHLLDRRSGKSARKWVINADLREDPKYKQHKKYWNQRDREAFKPKHFYVLVGILIVRRLHS